MSQYALSNPHMSCVSFHYIYKKLSIKKYKNSIYNLCSLNRKAAQLVSTSIKVSCDECLSQCNGLFCVIGEQCTPQGARFKRSYWSGSISLRVQYASSENPPTHASDWLWYLIDSVASRCCIACSVDGQTRFLWNLVSRVVRTRS